MSTVSTQRMVSDADVELIATTVVEFMRMPAARRGCRCGVCHNCRSREGMQKSRARREAAATRLAAKSKQRSTKSG